MAGEELNYRRFFDITTLAGLRVEDRDVYEQTHAVLVRHVRSGAVDGLRIDHPDGLADPQAYLQRVAADTDGAWVVAEKILEGSEQLPAEWQCAGTTGYDALNQITGLFVDPRAEAPFTELYEDLTGHPGDYRTVEAASKRHVVAHVLAAEVNRLTERLTSAAWAQPATRDLTRRGIREALVALLSDFEVYRAYVRPGEPVPESSRRVVEAASNARGRPCPPGPPSWRRWAGSSCTAPPTSWWRSSRSAARSWPKAWRTPRSTATVGCSRSTRWAGIPAASAGPSRTSTASARTCNATGR